MPQNKAVQIDGIDWESCKESIAALIGTAIDERLTAFSQATVKSKYISRKDFLREFRCSESKLWNLQRSGRLPFKKMGRAVYFERKLVEKLLQ